MAAGLAPSSGFLRDLPGASEALSKCRGMSMLIKGRKDTLFKQWCAEMSSNSSVWLDTSASVIKTSSDGGGDLEVTFDSRLLLATKEARAFTNAGYQIPKNLSAEVEAGERYYKYAVSLREVCIFYNQLSLDLLPFQKPMLLTEALAFEELLTKSKMSSWKGVEQLRTFTERAEEGRRRLKSLNDNLRLMHDQILSGIISLCDLSLLRQGERWRSALAELQRKVDVAAEDAGTSDKDSSTQLWRAHLDRQLKAVVEIQLIKGLQMFSKTLSDIRVDIISSGKKVVLKPSVEELRKKYYREVLKFVGRVGKIRGFGGAPGIFRKVCEDSSGVREALVAAYSQAEILFDKLEEERAGVEHWGVIGSVGEQRLAELVELYDDSGEALWEANLKQMKKKKRELERIPDFVKVDCFTVHMVILKAVVEEQIERFSLEMVISLKRRVNEQIKSLTEQLEASLGKLTAAPESIREIAVSESEVKKLTAELPSIGRQLEALSERATLIETAGGGAVVGLDRLRELCGAVTVKVESFGTIVEETREKLKSKMSGRIAELKGMVERYASRWQALKPVVEEGDSPFSTAVKEASDRMDEWKNDFSGIRTFADALRSDCAEFGMAPPEVGIYDSLESEISQAVLSWGIFSDFRTVLLDLGRELWLDFRPRITRLGQIIDEWREKILPRLTARPTPVDRMMVNYYNQLERAYPIIKSCMGGETFEKEHWKAERLEEKLNALDELLHLFNKGNSSKLVHTPLTDKCYMTLMHGLHLGYGGNPYGPAGTGKTESVKALGSWLGRQVLVFNCDEGIDYKSMTRIFVGLVRCGAWGCFDEFNRLLEEQMSAISQQIEVIQSAIKGKLPTVDLLGIIAMSVPDNELIAEVILFSEGFRSAKLLSGRIVSLFLLSSQLLSAEQHYDWGLRALKSVLMLAGQLLQREGAALGNEQESKILVMAARLSILAKLSKEDTTRFASLLEDIFPGVEAAEVDHGAIEVCVKDTLRENQMCVEEMQVSKILQLHEACKQRIGVSIVGPSGSGKTVIWRSLAGGLMRLGKSTSVHTINPKSMSKQQLLGRLNADTREWTDGALTAASRKVSKEPLETVCWIVCDGDVDPEWIESLNSVLDDNRLLTLPNGERIRFHDNVNFIFETDTLAYASPATVSRLGMVYLPEGGVPVEAVVERWLKQRGEKIGVSATAFLEWCESIFYRCLEWVKEHVSLGSDLGVEVSVMGLVRNVLSHVEEAIKNGLRKETFLLTVVRGLGGCISNSNLSAQLYRFAFECAKEVMPDEADPQDCTWSDELGRLIRYRAVSDAVPPWSSSIPLVKTPQVMMTLDLLQPHLRSGRHFILAGLEGSGKRLLVRHALAEIASGEFCCGVVEKGPSDEIKIRGAGLQCSGQTAARDVIVKLRSLCLIGAGEEGVLFQLKMSTYPKPDRYDTTQLVASLQEMVSYAVFHDEDLEWVALENIQFISTMAPSTALGRHTISRRFTSGVCQAWVASPSREDLSSIYSQLIRSVTERGEMVSLTEAMVGVYEQVVQNFGPEMDRLVGPKHRAKLDMILREVTEYRLGGFLSNAGSDRLLDSKDGPKWSTLREVSKVDYRKILSTGLATYERDVRPLGITLVDEVVDNLACLDRALGSRGGGSGCACVLMDHQLSGPADEFFGVLNALIASGESSELIQGEEREILYAQIKEEYQQEMLPGESIQEYLLRRTRENLMLVLSLDPTHPHFHDITSMNPGLFTRSTVLWNWAGWGRKSSLIVTSKALKSIVGGGGEAERLPYHKELCEATVEIHESTRSSQRYLWTLLKLWAAGFREHHERIGRDQERLKKGLDKLKDMHETVDELTREARVKEEELSVKERMASDSLKGIENGLEESAKMRKIPKREHARIESELAEIQPVLEEARKAVGSIRQDNLNEIRALKMPPEAIHDVLYGVLLLMGGSDSSWNAMKKFLSGAGVIQRVLNFDARKISLRSREEVERLLEERGRSFEDSVIRRASLAAAPLALWVKANVRYSRVVERVAPMELKLRQTEEDLHAARMRLRQCEAEREKITERVKEMQKEFAKRTGEAEALRNGVEEARGTLRRAVGLLEGLGEEKERWREETDRITIKMERLPVESMVAAAFMVYVGALGEDSRAEYLSDWESKLEARSIQNERFSFLNFTATESELLKLRSQGLGSDELSAENAMIILRSYKVAVPLITDPTQNSEVWLNRHLKEKGVQLTGSLDQGDLAFLHTLELSLRFGKTVLLALTEAKVDPVLFPLLRGDCHYTGSRRVIQLAERSVDFSDDFCIFLTCRDPGILGSIPPDVRSLLIGVNFTVTRQGLIRQLLGIVLSHDRPELEERRKELLANEETLKSRLMDLEDELLEQLAAVEGDVLGNQKLMESLNRTKDSATSIAESLQESARLQDALDEQRAMFRSIAVEGSELFMLMSDMNKVGSMYRFSLTEFIGIFTASLGEKQSGGPDEDLDIRLNDISTRLKGNVFEYVSRALFKRDRLTFAVMMARNAVAESIKENEWQLFMGNFVARDGISPLKEGHLSWCPVDRRAQLAKLVLALSELNAKAKMESPNLWRGWIEEDACEEKFPQEIALKLTSFQKVLIVQTLRPDRLESALVKFTTEVIFLDYDCLVVLTVPSISPSTSSLHTLCQAAEGFRPILFIVTPGADPTRDLTELAASTGQKLVSMAIGGGNEQDALEMLRNGMVEGHWVLIMNLHLALAWAGKIEVELRNGKPHRDFRCWLTTEPRENFPPILLESSLKVAFEFPPGVRNNVKRICESWDTRWFEAGDVSRSQVLFLCACFHAAVQERTSFIPQGWTKDYEFSTADLKSACETALQALKDDGSVEWPTLRGILENAVYGCRVDNTFDLRLVRQYVKDIFAQQAIDNGGDLLPFRLPATTSLGKY
ncbi:Cytoplasmic dynein 2 heavy chain 1 [Perkinsus olseni]|uniref:Cytoplasmic dynein 2 heavy chain 1 n=1 Tax=Perkinsus olseni TaxID=32597 RepID=A0A7J6NHU5_PEROL|nr:Cytoplasmic dynein 2 heavy chain 1 [Perkinsus olseni]